MLINKTSSGATELQALTASFYANNDFARVQTLWVLEESRMGELVGSALIARADAHYNSAAYKKTTPSVEEALNDKLVFYLQVPIAYRATLRYYELNTVSHETSGRKVKMNKENESMAWEWMLERDDAAQIRMANEATDMLITWLESNAIAEWTGSPNRAASRQLFINNPTLFHETYPIDLSNRFFFTIVPFIQEVQVRTIQKALGDHYAPLLLRWTSSQVESGSGSSGGGISSEDAVLDTFYDNLLLLVQKTQPLLAMVMALKRLSVQAMPNGVVQHFQSMFQGRVASSAPLPDMLKHHIANLEKDAMFHLDDIKILIQSTDPTASEYRLLPANETTSKFLRT